MLAKICSNTVNVKFLFCVNFPPVVTKWVHCVSQALHAKLEKESTSLEEMELKLTQRSEELIQLSNQLQEAKDREAELNASFEQLSEVKPGKWECTGHVTYVAQCGWCLNMLYVTGLWFPLYLWYLIMTGMWYSVFWTGVWTFFLHGWCIV